MQQAAIETITLSQGGRLIIDPRLNYRIIEGDGMTFTYRRDNAGLTPMMFPAKLETLIRELETDVFKINYRFPVAREPVGLTEELTNAKRPNNRSKPSHSFD